MEGDVRVVSSAEAQSRGYYEDGTIPHDYPEHCYYMGYWVFFDGDVEWFPRKDWADEVAKLAGALEGGIGVHILSPT